MPNSAGVPPKWALTCPRGHSNWEPVNGGFFCQSCERHDWPGDGAFQYVTNQQTGDDLDREAVRELEEEAKRQVAAEG